MKKFLLVSAVSVAAVLAGCGGGGDDSPPAPPVTTSVPDTASATVLGFIAYLKQLVVASADTLEPVDVSSVTPPTSDTTEPETVD